MIPENIKQLLMSSDEEDVALGLIIARKKRISIKELDKFADWMIDHNREHWTKVTMHVFVNYLVERNEHYSIWPPAYIKWKKHE